MNNELDPISRRDLLGCSVTFGLLALIPYKFAVEPTIRFAQLTLQTSDLENSARDKTARLRERYGFEVVRGDATKNEIERKINGKEPDLFVMNESLDTIERELYKYPPTLIREWCGLEMVRVLGGLNLDGRGVGGIALPKRIYLRPSASLARTLHHETYHTADYKKGLQHNNNNWGMLNQNGPASYHRNFDHTPVLNPFNSEFNPQRVMEFAEIKRPEGFFRAYGLVNEDEDQATFADALLSKPKEAHEILIADAVLKAKADAVKHEFWQWSNGLMNEQYWIDLIAGNVGQNYWDQKAA